MLCIALNKLKFFAQHGCYEAEKIVGGTFFVTIKMYTQDLRPCHTDNIDDAVNYQKVYTLIAQQMKKKCHLLEHLTFNIGQAILSEFLQIEKIELTVEKENPSLAIALSSSSVTLTLNR